MYTKSIIQQTIEKLHAKDNFRVALEQLMEKYNIEDSVFVMKNGVLHEAVDGYFTIENNYETLNEAISNCDITCMGIRILGGIFQTGKIHSRISECENGKMIFDLSRLENV